VETFEDVAPRVWIFPTEVPDGQWGGRGVIRHLPDIQAYIAGEHERKVGVERLARRRRAQSAGGSGRGSRCRTPWGRQSLRNLLPRRRRRHGGSSGGLEAKP